MDELLLNNEQLTTADIAYPDRARPASSAAIMDPNLQPEEISPASSAAGFSGPLFPQEELQSFRARWDQVQTSFVDEPRQAVEEADTLVANIVKRIAEQFAAEREQLEEQWENGENVSTEDLRQALKRYRLLFGRLLAF